MNRELIQNSIDYIEDNLKTEITAEELSKMAGFSVFHYYRLFQNAVGMPVMQFILRRKLLNATYEISSGSKMIDVALAYGFETHAGFYKAFLREFGYTPAQFLKKTKGKRPYRINILKEEHILVTHKKIEELLKHWGLEKEPLLDIIYEETGNRSESACYVGNDYVIKYSVNLGKVEANIAISGALEAMGLCAAAPMKTLDGKDYVLDGEIYFYVTRRLHGSPLKSSMLYRDDYATKARCLGEVIGQLSMALLHIDALTDDINFYESVTDWALPKLKGKVNISADLISEYTESFGKIYRTLPKQTIHRDPNPGNIIVSDTKWGFIDFELSERNIRIFDPCYAATAILSETFVAADEKKRHQWIEIYKNIIHGYDAVVKLTAEEKTAIPYVVLSNQMITCACFAEQEKYQELFETNKRMTEWILDNFAEMAIE